MNALDGASSGTGILYTKFQQNVDILIKKLAKQINLTGVKFPVHKKDCTKNGKTKQYFH